ncbi:uncharacterized protein LOC143540094 [Bidens hawaiensis]|uniref:uncharacterized protein LOC143540094 n=1 Tax=Bidens hawaiensis TaxID=980011 RepID=UPI00404A47B0
MLVDLTRLTFFNYRFPFFRVAYFGIWTCIFVIFQWIFHACVATWWPYDFLDLSTTYAPLWYLGLGLIHLPAYGIFALIVRKATFIVKIILTKWRNLLHDPKEVEAYFRMWDGS